MARPLSSEVAVAALDERLAVVRTGLASLPEGSAVREALVDFETAFSNAREKILRGVPVAEVIAAAVPVILQCSITRRSAMLIGYSDVVILLSGNKLDPAEVRHD